MEGCNLYWNTKHTELCFQWIQILYYASMWIHIRNYYVLHTQRDEKCMGPYILLVLS
jgi:hypothetical protein